MSRLRGFWSVKEELKTRASFGPSSVNKDLKNVNKYGNIEGPKRRHILPIIRKPRYRSY